MSIVLRNLYRGEILTFVTEFRKDAIANMTRINQIPSSSKEDRSFNVVRYEAIVCNLLLRCRKSGYFIKETNSKTRAGSHINSSFVSFYRTEFNYNLITLRSENLAYPVTSVSAAVAAIHIFVVGIRAD
jgi:hypothetical protein